MHSEHRAMCYMQPRVIGQLVIAEGPRCWSVSRLSATGGFDPVDVPFLDRTSSRALVGDRCCRSS